MSKRRFNFLNRRSNFFFRRFSFLERRFNFPKGCLRKGCCGNDETLRGFVVLRWCLRRKNVSFSSLFRKVGINR